MLTELDRFDLWPNVPLTCEDYGHFHQVRAVAPGPDVTDVAEQGAEQQGEPA